MVEQKSIGVGTIDIQEFNYAKLPAKNDAVLEYNFVVIAKPNKLVVITFSIDLLSQSQTL